MMVVDVVVEIDDIGMTMVMARRELARDNITSIKGSTNPISDKVKIAKTLA